MPSWNLSCGPAWQPPYHRPLMPKVIHGLGERVRIGDWPVRYKGEEEGREVTNYWKVQGLPSLEDWQRYNELSPGQMGLSWSQCRLALTQQTTGKASGHDANSTCKVSLRVSSHPHAPRESHKSVSRARLAL